LKQDIKSMTHPELKCFVAALGEPEYRAKQLMKWFARGAASFDDMTDIPAALRAKLSEHAHFHAPDIAARQISKKDRTAKYLFRLFDENAVECVLMRYRHGNSVCVSTQVGCRMGCAFCASAGGLLRNLAASEMLDQVVFSARDAGQAVSHIVLMGTGEPLDNFEQVVRFIGLANDPNGLGISQRHISLSTCGLTDKIEALAGLQLQITLSVSLHAPFDELRNKIMPVNRLYGIDVLLRACREYFKRTGRRISYEYAMISGVNDTDACLSKLISLFKHDICHINLIALNNTGRGFSPSSASRIRAFQGGLEAAGINATLRRSLGSDIDGACGQLRRRLIGGS